MHVRAARKAPWPNEQEGASLLASSSWFVAGMLASGARASAHLTLSAAVALCLSAGYTSPHAQDELKRKLAGGRCLVLRLREEVEGGGGGRCLVWTLW